jgi:hypothetical protein
MSTVLDFTRPPAALPPLQRLTLAQEQLQYLAIAADRLRDLQVEVITASTTLAGEPMIEVSPTDAERAFGPQGQLLAAAGERCQLRGLPFHGCLVHWYVSGSAA